MNTENTLYIRRADERGLTQNEWLHSWHSFSFGGYLDRDFMGFRALRVINEDRIAPRGGFPLHPHRDMEILTVLLRGALEHQDSTGSRSILEAGHIQRMTAGSGIMHSEFNASDREEVHLLQIWITPWARGLAPSYEERHLPELRDAGVWYPLARPKNDPGEALLIEQDASVDIGSAQAGHPLTIRCAQGRYTWLQVIEGSFESGAGRLSAGDALACTGPNNFALHGQGSVVLFDLP